MYDCHQNDKPAEKVDSKPDNQAKSATDEAISGLKDFSRQAPTVSEDAKLPSLKLVDGGTKEKNATTNLDNEAKEKKPADVKKAGPAGDTVAKDTVAKDVASKDGSSKDTATKDTPKDPVVKDTATKDASKDPVVKDTATKDAPSKDPVVKDTATKDAPSKDPVVKDTATKDAPSKDPVVKDTATKDAPKDPVVKDTATKDAPKDPVVKDTATKDTVLKDTATKDTATKDTNGKEDREGLIGTVKTKDGGTIKSFAGREDGLARETTGDLGTLREFKGRADGKVSDFEYKDPEGPKALKRVEKFQGENSKERRETLADGTVTSVKTHENRADGLRKETSTKRGTYRQFEDRQDGKTSEYEYASEKGNQGIKKVESFGIGRRSTDVNGKVTEEDMAKTRGESGDQNSADKDRGIYKSETVNGNTVKHFFNRDDGLSKQVEMKRGTAREFQGRADGKTYEYEYASEKGNQGIKKVEHFGTGRRYTHVDGKVTEEDMLKPKAKAGDKGKSDAANKEKPEAADKGKPETADKGKPEAADKAKEQPKLDERKEKEAADLAAGKRRFDDDKDGMIKEGVMKGVGVGRHFEGRADGMTYAFRYDKPNGGLVEVHKFGNDREEIFKDGSKTREFHDRKDGLVKESKNYLGTGKTFSGREDGLTFHYKYNKPNGELSEVKHYGNDRVYINSDGTVTKETLGKKK